MKRITESDGATRPPDGTVSLAMAAQLLGCTRSTIDAMLTRGLLASTSRGDGATQIPMEQIERALRLKKEGLTTRVGGHELGSRAAHY